MRHYASLLAGRQQAADNTAAATAAANLVAKMLSRRKDNLNRLEFLKWIPIFMKVTKPVANTQPQTVVQKDVEEVPIDFKYLKCSWDPTVVTPDYKVSLAQEETKMNGLSNTMANAINNRPPQYGWYSLANIKPGGSNNYYSNPLTKPGKGCKHAQMQKAQSVNMDSLEMHANIIFQRFDKDHKAYLNLVDFKKLLRSAGVNSRMPRRRFSANVRHDFKLMRRRGERGIGCEQFVAYYRYMQALAAGHRAAPGTTANMLPECGRGTTTPWPKPSLDPEFQKPKFKTFAAVVEAVMANREMGANYDIPSDLDTLSVGGLPSVIIAASKGDMDMVVALVSCSAYDRVLADAEREAIVRAAVDKDVARVQRLLKDLFTQATQRKSMVDALVSEDLDLSRQRMKETYYAKHGRTLSLPSDAPTPNGGLLPLMHKRACKRAAANNKRKINQRLVSACLRHDVTAVRECLVSGADPNAKDVGGSTPLVHVAWYGYIDVAEVLLEFGAKVHLRNLRGNTAMHFCLEKNNKEMLILFLSRGGARALLLPNLIGKTPHDLCTDMFVRDICAAAVTLVHKDSVHAPHRAYNVSMCGHKDGYIGKAADEMRKACHKGDLRRLKHLVKAGLGSIHRPDRYGTSPLMHAALEGHPKVVRYLLTQGVDVYHATCNGNTVLHFVLDKYQRCRTNILLEARYRTLAKLLLGHGGERLRQMRNEAGQVAEDLPACV